MPNPKPPEKAKKMPRWNLDEDLSFRKWWSTMLGYLSADVDPQHKGEKLAAGWIRKLATDPALREKFTKNPAAALARLDIKVPASLKIQVVENTPNKMFIVMPALTNAKEYAKHYQPVDLTDGELESFVSGVAAVSLFQDDWDVVSLADGSNHDVDMLPFQTDNTGDKFKSKPKNTRNDIFGI